MRSAILSAAALLLACGGDDTSTPQPVNDGGPTRDTSILLPDGAIVNNPDGATSTDSPALAFTKKLGGAHAGHFLIGMGNDGTNDGNDDAYNLGVTLDLHYHYLVGLSTAGGWTTWNSNPDYAGKRIAEATKRGVVPMLTYYGMASNGDGNIGVLTDAAFMKTYFKDFSQMLSDIKAAGVPVVLHFEPDFLGYLQQATGKDGIGPDKRAASPSAFGASECAGEPETVVGFAHCIYAVVRARAPNALLGFHASAFSTNMDVDRNRDPKFDVAAEGAKTVAFFKQLGLDRADFVSTDTSDRDAGCYEANHQPMCACTKTANYQCDDFYWDETNQTLPNFAQHFKWVKSLTDGLKLPMIWWQIPFGDPSGTAGGQIGAWRDNRAHYFFAHVNELIAAGGVGAVWGTGAGDQTYLTQSYKDAVKKYFAAPVALP